MAKSAEVLFFESVKRLTELAYVRLHNSLAYSENDDDGLWYHSPEHTVGVNRRAAKIVDICNRAQNGLFSERDRALVRLAVCFHDIYIASYVTIDPLRGYLVRKRLGGHSEHASAGILHRYMYEENVRHDHECEIFTAADFDFVQETIMLTVVKLENGTVLQPIKTDTSLRARILPLADLGECGMEPELFVRNSNFLLCEEQPSIQAAVLGERMKSAKSIRDDILAWGEQQVAFVEGRRNRTHIDLSGLLLGMGCAIWDFCFSDLRFDESLKLVTEQNKRRSKMSCSGILQEMRTVCGIYK